MTYEQYAIRYRVSLRTVKRWAAKGAPLGDDPAMIEWARGQTNLPAGFLGWIDDQSPKKTAPAEGADNDWAEFERLARTDDPKASMEKIAKARDFASFKFEKASQVDARGDMKFFADLLAKMESCLHDAQLRAKKLGVDEGELLPRPEVERIAWALAYWTLRAVDQNLDALSSKLAALSPGLEAGPIRAVLEPELLSARFLTPYARAAKIQSGVTLPEWLVAKMRESVGDYLEDGEAAFDTVEPADIA
jgi:hypothetical protein